METYKDMNDNLFRFAIDRGGTFTDVFAICPGRKIRVMKLLSTDPKNYSDAPREGIRRIMQQETGIIADEEIDDSQICWIRMGTTVATNALIERKGAKIALVINEGFKDLLDIGSQARPNIFDLEIVKPDVLYTDVIEVRGRIIPALWDKCKLNKDSWRKAKSSSGTDYFITQELDEIKLEQDLRKTKEKGIESLAVVLMHSYACAEHEICIGKIAARIGFKQVSLSHEVMPMSKIVSRGLTTCVDAYLTPHIKKYLKSFSKGFKNKLSNTTVLFMQSDGGLTPMNSFIGSRAILSGPAGGVVGYAMSTYQNEFKLPIIGFDMGGTSTDISRYNGSYEHVFETMIAGVTIQVPQLDINTVAAGGGSMLFFRSGLFEVGPDSAGAQPGPTCYQNGGPLTVTDANLVLGRLLPEFFPKMFGPNKNKSLDKALSLRSFKKLTSKINQYYVTKSNSENKFSVEEVAMGFIKVANESMCRPIRALTEAKGHDTAHHILVCFGGAGGQHACAIARALNMQTVFIHKYAGILSAYGMALADIVEEAQEPCAEIYNTESFQRLDEKFDTLEKKVKSKLLSIGFTESKIHIEFFLHLRYEGTNCVVACKSCENGDETPNRLRHGDYKTTFMTRYKKEFGFLLPERKIVVNDIRVRGVGKMEVPELPVCSTSMNIAKPEQRERVYFDGSYLETDVYQLKSLCFGQSVRGPAIIMDSLSTILIEPSCVATITKEGNIKISVGATLKSQISTDLNSVQLSIFSHRFMSIAEQMGRILQRTSVSTNIKERLDFSCAIFGPDGGLVSNAPHIPVHLGAMQETVKYQIKTFGGNFNRGDAILSNHPEAGGSHLPDLTVITPIFYRDAELPVFFVASRGHHADIGGITPGSMPPYSMSLIQEGAAFKSFLLVHNNIFREKEVSDKLKNSNKMYGIPGTRNLTDNISDLKAQIAANQKGAQLVIELIEFYSLDVVQAYMKHIQDNAELAVREMFKSIGKNIRNTKNQNNQHTITTSDYLDDGSEIILKLEIDSEKGEAVFDFTGTSYEVIGNCNSPRAITISAIIYCLRSIVGRDIPLNQGCLKPVQIIIPKGSLLDPSEDAAVVGGNVLTSQRIVDVILSAFNICAASQGCMNNITLGTEEWGYYETVAGGSGAGPTWDGKGGVHTHMTNTRITDPEILELRYPILLRKFLLRHGSGGDGLHRGGDGVIRELFFRATMMLSVLTERRVHSPPGLDGGQPGARGKNTLKRLDKKAINMGPKAAVSVNPGDAFLLETPGGGGYGKLDEI